jgi:SPX domain protein involved in polyphosphate accumulation
MSDDYRYEIKFVLDNARLSNAMQWLYNKTTATKTYSNRKVNSIYFDDVGFSSVRDNLAGISCRNKLRLRWYGDKNYTKPIFEVKIKNGRLGRKEFYPITSLENNLSNLNTHDITLKCAEGLIKQNVILDENLVATLQVSYEREYYETHDGIRITIDQDIQFSDVQMHTTLEESSFFPYPYSVMEIKFKPDMKELVSDLIRPLHITPKRHSKYLIGLAMLGYVVYI